MALRQLLQGYDVAGAVRDKELVGLGAPSLRVTFWAPCICMAAAQTDATLAPGRLRSRLQLFFHHRQAELQITARQSDQVRCGDFLAAGRERLAGCSRGASGHARSARRASDWAGRWDAAGEGGRRTREADAADQVPAHARRSLLEAGRCECSVGRRCSGGRAGVFSCFFPAACLSVCLPSCLRMCVCVLRTECVHGI